MEQIAKERYIAGLRGDEKMFKVIRFSEEHIHIVQKHGRGAQAHLKVNCVMSRNWNRCTAPDIAVKDWPDLDPSQNRSYYDGDKWSKVNVSDFDYCPECQVSEPRASR